MASLLFLLVVLVPMAGPWHLLAGSAAAAGTTDGPSPWVVLPGVAAGLAVGAAAVVVPLRMGIGALREMEF